MFRKIALLMASTVIVATPIAAQTAGAGSGDPAFDAKFRAVLMAHPEWVAETMQNMQQRAQATQAAELSKQVAQYRPELARDKAQLGVTVGNKAAKTTIYEFLDYACPFCKRAHVTVDQLAAQRQDVNFVIIQRPILGPESEVLSRFALAANLQGRFAQTHDALYDKFGDDHQTKATDDNLREVAQKAGIDFDRAKRDMQDPRVSAMLEKGNALAQKLSVNGTPFFITPDAAYPGAVPGPILEKSIK